METQSQKVLREAVADFIALAEWELGVPIQRPSVGSSIEKLASMAGDVVIDLGRPQDIVVPASVRDEFKALFDRPGLELVSPA